MVETLTTGVREVKSVDRTVEVLEYLSTRQASPAKLAEVVQAVNAPRSSVYALLRTLVSSGWVDELPDQTYALGIHVLTTGMSYIDADPYVRLVRPVLADLVRITGETFHLGRADDSDIVYLATQESQHEVRMVNRIGRRLPLTATALGKAILTERSELIPENSGFKTLTEESTTNKADLEKQLKEFRRLGYAYEIAEALPGIRCYAVALRYTEPIKDSISCSIPIRRWNEELEVKVVDSLLNAATRIESMAPAQAIHPI